MTSKPLFRPLGNAQAFWCPFGYAHLPLTPSITQARIVEGAADGKAQNGTLYGYLVNA